MIFCNNLYVIHNVSSSRNAYKKPSDIKKCSNKNQDETVDGISFEEILTKEIHKNRESINGNNNKFIL